MGLEAALIGWGLSAATAASVSTGVIVGGATAIGVGAANAISSSMSKGAGGKSSVALPTAPVAPIQALDQSSKSAQAAQSSQMSLMRGLQSTWNNQSMMTSKAGFANTSTPKSSTLG